eukprot:6759259-Prymnesium_polylepis.1
MAVGEVVLLSCSSAYAYGDAGAPPLIPPGADMVFELEVVSVRNLQSSHNPEEVKRQSQVAIVRVVLWLCFAAAQR